MLEQVKLSIRYRNNLFDNEINMYIDACKTNLSLAGIKLDKVETDDPAILNAVICYVKWQLNFQNKGVDWKKNYDSLKCSLVLDRRYRDAY